MVERGSSQVARPVLIHPLFNPQVIESNRGAGYFFHLSLDGPRINSAGLPPKINHDPSRGPSHTGPQHRPPETGAAARIVDAHRTWHLRESAGSGGSAFYWM